MRERQNLWLAIILSSVMHAIFLFMYPLSSNRSQDPRPTETLTPIFLVAMASKPLSLPRTLAPSKGSSLPKPEIPPRISSPLTGAKIHPLSKRKFSPSLAKPTKVSKPKNQVPKITAGPLSPSAGLTSLSNSKEEKGEKAPDESVTDSVSLAKPIDSSAKVGPINGRGDGKKEDQDQEWGEGMGETKEGFVEASPRYANNPKPTYPLLARRRGYHGTVLLQLLVLADGRVDEVEVLKSSGYSILDNSALKAAKKWRFYPAMKGAIPVTSWVKIPITFNLLNR